jgi:hypothetical protein
MKALLDRLLPHIFPGWVEKQHFLCVPHEGKRDLDKSIPVKLRAWQERGVRFVIVRDNDNANCILLKNDLIKLCQDSGRPDTLIRLVCQELESWYLGDLHALDKAFGTSIDTPKNRKRFAHPDTWEKSSHEIKRLIPTFQKIGGARNMAEHLQVQNNLSHSCRIFFAGIQKIAQEMKYTIDTGNTA